MKFNYNYHFFWAKTSHKGLFLEVLLDWPSCYAQVILIRQLLICLNIFILIHIVLYSLLHGSEQLMYGKIDLIMVLMGKLYYVRIFIPSLEQPTFVSTLFPGIHLFILF